LAQSLLSEYTKIIKYGSTSESRNGNQKQTPQTNKQTNKTKQNKNASKIIFLCTKNKAENSRIEKIKAKISYTLAFHSKVEIYKTRAHWCLLLPFLPFHNLRVEDWFRSRVRGSKEKLQKIKRWSRRLGEESEEKKLRGSFWDSG
jgi:anti-sigma28 factor (negative regulator of flagellin synthesis)